MTRRYRWHDEPVVRQHLFVVPSGETVSVAPAGYTVRLRGDREGTVVHSYRCPVHGLFDASVRRSDVPDEIRCQVDTSSMGLGLQCAAPAPWAGSLCGIGFAAGEVTG